MLYQEYWEYNELGNKTLHRQYQCNSNSDTFEEVWEYDANGYMTAYTKYRNDGRVAEHIEYINLEGLPDWHTYYGIELYCLI